MRASGVARIGSGATEPSVSGGTDSGISGEKHDRRSMGVDRRDAQDEVPSFFRKDWHPIHSACVVGFALSYSTSSSQGNLLEYLGTLYSTTAIPAIEGLVGIIACVLPTWVPVFLIVLAIMGAACWEATRFPRLGSHGTPWEALRTMLQFLGDLLMAPLRAVMPGERPIIDFQETTQNARILAMCPSLKHFKQTPWLHNSNLSFAVLMWGDLAKSASSKPNVRRERLTTSDGGAVALDWWEPPDQAHIRVAPRKVLFVGSTFTGDAVCTITREFCEYFTALGWLCVVHVKRGCGLTMPNEQPPRNAAGDGPVRPWCLSGFEDIVLGIDHVASLYPEAVICAVGLSTGAGQLRNYVNSLGEKSKLSAAVLVDAAPAWGPALEAIDRSLPLVAKALASAAHVTVSSLSPAEGRDKLVEERSRPVPSRPCLSGGLTEFAMQVQAPAHGFASTFEGFRRYCESCQPACASGCAVPVLSMGTYNDTLITPEMQDINRLDSDKSPNVISATTREGTHMVRWEGLIPECWLRKASGEFLEAVLRVTRSDA